MKRFTNNGTNSTWKSWAGISRAYSVSMDGSFLCSSVYFELSNFYLIYDLKRRKTTFETIIENHTVISTLNHVVMAPVSMLMASLGEGV